MSEQQGAHWSRTTKLLSNRALPSPETPRVRQELETYTRVPPCAKPELRESVRAFIGPASGGDSSENDVSQGFLRVAVLDASGGCTLQEPIQVEVETVGAVVVHVARIKHF